MQNIKLILLGSLQNICADIIFWGSVSMLAYVFLKNDRSQSCSVFNKVKVAIL
jgi:hypothetical protein